VPGVVAVTVGGHSPGQQVLLVEGASRDVVLASDATHFDEELEQERPFAVVHDVERMQLAYDLLKEHARGGATVVAGHEPAVAHAYERVEQASAAEVVRIA
jgi:glyoxylase-like metal-dependent hydrolase (beta-lactamase superfamily II)